MGFYLNAKSIQLVGALTPPPKKKNPKEKTKPKENKQTNKNFFFFQRQGLIYR